MYLSQLRQSFLTLNAVLGLGEGRSSLEREVVPIAGCKRVHRAYDLHRLLVGKFGLCHDHLLRQVVLWVAQRLDRDMLPTPLHSVTVLRGIAAQRKRALFSG